MKSIKIFYDPLGRPQRTVNPDNTEQRVVFGTPNNSDLSNPNDYNPTPWERFSYDANDLAPITHPLDNTTNASHHYTPKSERIDALGRTVQTTDHKGHLNTTTQLFEDVIMKYEYDIKGQLMRVIDPENREVFTHKYDTAGNNLWTEHLDSGINVSAIDSTGKPLYSKDAKGAEVYTSFDDLHRPISLWAKDKTGEPITKRQFNIYGDNSGLTETEIQTKNLNGKPYKSYDEAGLVEITEYDFKGNPLEKKRTVIKDQLQFSNASFTIDWTGLDEVTLLESGTVYQTNMAYDGINRARNITLPIADIANRPIMTPTYNRAGALHQLKLDNTDYIKEIAYNAKGQRLLVVTGNTMMTRYNYREDNFRLNRIRTEGYTKSGTTYTPVLNTLRQNLKYNYDLNGNIIKLGEELDDVGILNSTLGINAIEKNFNYDPINRLLSATGRESNSNTNSNFWGVQTNPVNPNANNTRAFTRNYEYDKVGNIQKLQHVAIGAGFTRRYNYISGVNRLFNIDNNQSTPTNHASYQYDSVGNQTNVNTERYYEWDVANQLKFYKNQTGNDTPSVQAQYHYAGGERVKKETKDRQGNTEVTIYIDGLIEHRYKKNNSNVIGAEQTIIHIMDGRSRIATVRTGDNFGDTTAAIKYNLEDHLGTSTVRLDNTGVLIDREEYYPFGDSSLRTFTKKRYRYVGKEKDSESGLYYYGARYYSAWTCRFISIDPLADKYADLNPYNYAGNKPINKIDIDGLQEENKTETKTPESKKESEFVSYTVKAGETLYSIANHFGIDKYDMINTNNIDPYLGQEVKKGQSILLASITEEKLTAIENEYQDYLKEGSEKKGFEVAVSNLELFLQPDGTTEKTIDGKWVSSFEVVQEVMQDLMERVVETIETNPESLPEGQTVNDSEDKKKGNQYWFSQNVDPGFIFSSEDHPLTYAIGGFLLTAESEVTAIRSGDKVEYSVKIIYSLSDMYDWHGGVNVPTSLFGRIEDSDANLLKEFRGAKEFNMTSEWTRSFTGSIIINNTLWFNKESWTEQK